MIALIADLHDHLVNFDEFLRQTTGRLTQLWIAGDIGTADTLDYVCSQFALPIFAVAGNAEQGHRLADYDAVAGRHPHLTWANQAPLVFGSADLRAALFHFPASARVYAQAQNARTVICGHSHRPALTKIGKVWLINPGTLAGVFAPATYVLADAELTTFTLHRLYQL